VSRSLVALCEAYVVSTFLTRLPLQSPIARAKTKHMEQECFLKIYFPLASQYITKSLWKPKVLTLSTAADSSNDPD